MHESFNHIVKHVDYCQSYALGRQNLQAGLVVLKEQFRTCRIHLSLSTPLQSRDWMLTKHKFITKRITRIFIYLFLSPKIYPVGCLLGSVAHAHCLTCRPARESILRARDGDNNLIQYGILLSIMEADF